MSTAAPLTIDALAGKLDAVLAPCAAPAPRFFTVDASAAYCSLSPESIRRLISWRRCNRCGR